MNIAVKCFFLCVMVSLLSPGTAHAYFDPGAGSMLLQALSAGLVAILVFWGKIKRAVRRLFSKKGPDE